MINFTKKEGVLLAIAFIIAGAFYMLNAHLQETDNKLDYTIEQLEEREDTINKLSKQIEDMQNNENVLRRKLNEKIEAQKRYDRTVTMLTSRGTDRRNAENKVYIYNFLTEKGMSPVAIAGIMGNIEQESRYMTTSDNGSHRGICQWDYGNRWSRFQHNYGDVDSIESQVAYMWRELNERGLVHKLNQAPDVYTATKIFDDHFEASGGSELHQRINYAHMVYEAIA